MGNGERASWVLAMAVSVLVDEINKFTYGSGESFLLNDTPSTSSLSAGSTTLDNTFIEVPLEEEEAHKICVFDSFRAR